MPTVRYLVDDVDRAVAFYTGKLGFSLTERWGKVIAMVARDGLTLWLSGPDSSAARPMPDGRKPEPGGWNRVVVQVPDLVALHKAMKQDGAAFRNEIVEGPGGKQILVEDGCGNVVELFQPAS
jgi:catechol 2,3-dioxygenase-like lactoylglutathione lyase family enzyme